LICVTPKSTVMAVLAVMSRATVVLEQLADIAQRQHAAHFTKGDHAGRYEESFHASSKGQRRGRRHGTSPAHPLAAR
jgi:hypothetical protein